MEIVLINKFDTKATGLLQMGNLENLKTHPVFMLDFPKFLYSK